ncbi:MAG: DUF2398 family protein [Lentisphaeria bacterium]|jgi:hypothetical protein|nr:DUF2398 family protein [Lentisphaeria bacterium]
MDHPLGNLLEDYRDRVVTALNVLVEAPYFYREDDEETFFFLRRHRRQFAAFLEQSFGWRLVLDDRCARVFKEKWHNPAITESQRDIFRFGGRDECLAFMMILEFFEHQLDENSMTVEDRDPLKFRLGDLLSFLVRRFGELFPGEAETRYTEEAVRKSLLREVMPRLLRYRFLRRLPPPQEMGRLDEAEHIYEALPAMYHYNTTALARWSEPGPEDPLPGLADEEGDAP